MSETADGLRALAVFVGLPLFIVGLLGGALVPLLGGGALLLVWLSR